MNPVITKFKPEIVREDLYGLNTSQIPLPDNFEIYNTFIISINCNGYGGNHYHQRKEIFVGFGELLLVYKIENEIKEVRFGNGIEEKVSIYIPPFLPHAVKNIGEHPAILYELGDSEMIDPHNVDLVK